MRLSESPRSLRVSAVSAALVTLLGLFSGCAGDADPTPSSEDDLKGGVVAREAVYGPVGALGAPGSTSFNVSCTGTLVAPKVVLTAKHCVTSDPEGDAFDKLDAGLYFAPGLEASLKSPRYKVVSAAAAKLAEGGFIEYGSDVALLQLESAPPGLTPALVRAAHPAVQEVGKKLTVVGFGFDETDKNGIRKRGTVTLRATGGRALGPVFSSRTALDSLIEKKEGDRSALSPDDDRSAQVARYWEHQLLPTHEAFVGLAAGDAQPCRSDSGAPVLVLENGRPVVVAVISGSLKLSRSPCGSYGSFVGTFGDSAQALFAAKGVAPTAAK